jgi:hypothetical protein
LHAAVITDAFPRLPVLRKEYEASDARPTLTLPPAAPLQEVTRALDEALKADDQGAVTVAGTRMLADLAAFYRIPQPGLSVLGSRPHQVVGGHLAYELYGDYTLATGVIRVWMRTAVFGRVTSHRGLLNTLLHEFCHHLDIAGMALPSTPHTRGFYGRVDDLYHLALATPPEQRKPLVWIRSGSSWRLDWRKVRPSKR